MFPIHRASALPLFLLLCCFTTPILGAPPEPIAILTLANLAHLDEADAFPGLSVYEGEQLQTEAGGRIALRSGSASLGLAEKTVATLVRIAGGMHADLDAGTIRFSCGERQVVEVHAEEALIRSQNAKPTDGAVTILSPKLLQIDARRGNLDFSYRQTFRTLPEGQIYRIDLDAPDRSESEASVGAQPGGLARQVTYYILATGAGGATGWLTYQAVHSGNTPISPAKP